MLNTDNCTTFLLFQILTKVREKARVLKAFSAAKIFFAKPMLGSPSRPIRDIFEFSCLCLLAETAAKICEPISAGDPSIVCFSIVVV